MLSRVSGKALIPVPRGNRRPRNRKQPEKTRAEIDALLPSGDQLDVDEGPADVEHEPPPRFAPLDAERRCEGGVRERPGQRDCLLEIRSRHTDLGMEPSPEGVREVHRLPRVVRVQTGLFE